MIVFDVITNLYVAGRIEFDGFGSDIRTSTLHNLLDILEYPHSQTTFLFITCSTCKQQKAGVRVSEWDYDAHCKNIWITSTIIWSSQLHACCVVQGYFQFESQCSWEASPFLLKLESFCRRPSISGGVWCFFNLTHLLLEEFLGCMVTVEMSGM